MRDEERDVAALCHELSIKVVEDKNHTAGVSERGWGAGADPRPNRGRGAISCWGPMALCEVVEETTKERSPVLPILPFILLPLLLTLVSRHNFRGHSRRFPSSLKSNAFYFHRPEFRTFCEFWFIISPHSINRITQWQNIITWLIKAYSWRFTFEKY